MKKQRLLTTTAIGLAMTTLASCSPFVHRTGSLHTAPTATTRLVPPRPDDPAAARRFRRKTWLSADGTIPDGALLAALRQRQENLEFWRDRGQSRSAGITPASWRSRGPSNVGGRTRSLVIDPRDPERMFAGSVGGGIFKTSDGGLNWSPVDDWMPNLAANSLAIDPTNPDTLYCGTGEGYFNGDAIGGAGMFKSIDGGATWSQLAATASWSTTNRIAISPTDPLLLMASVRWGGLHRSTDGGASWTNVLWTQGSFDVAFHPTDGNRVVAHIIDWDWVTSEWFHAALYSLDGGQTWTAATGLDRVLGFGSRIALAYAPSDAAIVYANSGGDGRIWRSIDGGQSYSPMTTSGTTQAGWYYDGIWVAPNDPDFLVTAGYQLQKSTDGGVSLTPISDGYILTEQAHPDVHYVTAAPGFDGISNKRVYVTTDGGVFRTDDIFTVDTSTGWVSLVQGYQASQFYGAAGHGPTDMVVGGTQDNGTLRTLTGDLVANLTFGGDGGYTQVDPDDPSYVYGEYIYLEIHRSTNGGVWSDWIYNGIADAGVSANFIAPFILDPNQPRRLLAGGASLWRSDDARAPVPQYQPIRDAGTDVLSAIAVAPGDPDVLWVGQNNGGIARTLDGRSATPTWVAIDDNSGLDPLPNRFVTRILIDELDSETVYVAFGGFDDDSLWRTSDGGATWSDVTGSGPTGLPRAPIRGLAQHPRRDDWLYVGTEVGVFSSEDAGATWSATNVGPANVSVDEIVFLSDSSTLLAATHGRGMWTADTCGVPPPGEVGNTLVLTRLAASQSIQATWTDVAGADAYGVYRDDERDGRFLGLVTTAPPASQPIFTAPPGLQFLRVGGLNDCAVGPR